jgi:hypothetical protein
LVCLNQSIPKYFLKIEKISYAASTLEAESTLFCFKSKCFTE